MQVPNWQKHSKKDKKSKGTCKGLLKSRRQSLKSLLNKIKK